MKKLLALIAAMLLVGAGIASATDFSMSGSYFARGTYDDNAQEAPGEDVESFMDYDHELNVNLTFKIDDTSGVKVQVEARDERWTGDSNSSTVDEGHYSSSPDDNIVIEKAYGYHKFANGGTLSVGLMSGGAWSTDFGNAGGDKYRVKWVQATGIGKLIAILEKDRESGNTSWGEDDDQDTYILGLVTPMGDMKVMPLIAWVDSNDPSTADLDLLVGDLAITGTMGAVGFEAEARILDYDFSQSGPDATVYGVYGNVWMNMDALKVGVLAAYGNYDEDAGRSFTPGDDFAGGGAFIIGDAVTFGGSNALLAPTLIAGYMDYKVNDKLSVGAYIGYATCGIEDGSMWDDADVYEVSVDGKYSITPNVIYSFAAGTAQMEYGGSGYNADRTIKMEHKLTFKF